MIEVPLAPRFLARCFRGRGRKARGGNWARIESSYVYGGSLERGLSLSRLIDEAAAPGKPDGR
jgi:hypothetical protein